MTVLWEPQSALLGLIGGMLIGLSALGLMFVHNRIAGISGLLKSLLGPGEKSLPIAFLTGLCLMPALLLLSGQVAAAEFAPWSHTWLLIAGGCVGLGAGLGNGCTSGHGVCGLARLSPRSAAAVCTFMGTGFATVGLMRLGGLMP